MKIELRNISKVFGSRPQQALAKVEAGMTKDELLSATNHTLGLHDISLSIDPGQIFVIMGLSGSGKSTLIRHFNRLIEPTAGQILVDGEDVMQLSRSALNAFRRRRMSMVFQHFGLMPHKSVLDNAAYGLAIQGVPKAERLQRARHWLQQVGLQGVGHQYPHQLSGGMQQRVGLARALATDPDILLMDEAFSALDPLIRREMQDQLLTLQLQLKKTIVFITHDLDEALRLGNRIAILKDGRLVQEGTPEEILLNPADSYVESFLQDVNRSRALTAAHAASQAPVALTTRTTPDKAIALLQNSRQEYACVLQGTHLEGFVTLTDLLRARNEQAHEIRDYLQDAATVSANAGLSEAVAHLLHSDSPLAVTTEDGRFCGWLSRSKVAKLLNAA